MYEKRVKICDVTLYLNKNHMRKCLIPQREDNVMEEI